MHRVCRSLALVAAALAACAPTWKAPLVVDHREVARALHDPADVGARFDPKAVPVIAAPHKLRPCCAFGQDLRAEVGPVPVPLYKNENIRSPDELGPHGYDRGGASPERNGLVYTCRGGFLDIAHVRDTADKTLFLTLQLVRALPGEVTVEWPDEGTQRRVKLKALPKGLLERHGRWKTATLLAGWAVQQLATWHEVVTWYGFESVPGVSERLSAFSPEDVYSNVLGINLAAGLILDGEIRSREAYDTAMQAWLREALRRLGAVSKQEARAAMQAVDGRWWDSRKRIPEFTLVTRRYVHNDSPVPAWLVDAPDIRKTCSGQPPPLPLVLEQKIGEHEIAALVTVEFEFDSWLPERFPLPIARGSTVTPRDFSAIFAGIRAEAVEAFGPDFDKPDDG
ncbi:DUF4056 domain-containing protein [Nannocystis pusilla]|uniref:DUF4056 domain-containing protein n=1 Tax=Nannocystis pusilla TaxID=889268 RepID=A0ABS7TZS8_9BACT|nr:DUF4056 domain-containing protein [Nannocystis pusilla]MBZ5713783.1 DUF4056 domain-containing protein [Nannocystis pusilla]